MTTIFAKVPAELNFPAEEGEILRFWKERKIFEKSLEERKGKPSFVFYEGPPTANGMPHNGHVLTRVIKDLFPRYKTMRGFSVPRKAGWDTHGLPVEVEVEKELHIHGKAAIEAYGVEPFVAKCIQSVFRYTSEWETLTDRVAFWCDLKDAYVTYHKEYVESVWWALSELLKKGLLYKGHKVVWWWAQGGTALSSAEVGLGYKSVEDPSVFVAFPLVAEPDVSLLVWTTTPWTLPSNMYAAVNPDFHYVVAKVDAGEHEGRRFVVAKDLLPSIAKKLKSELTVERETTGASLIGQKYRPPFDLFARSPEAAEAPLAEKVFTVIPGSFVTLDVGTGLVHIAPAFGEDDMLAHRALFASDGGVTVAPFCAIKPDGTFIPELTAYAGRWVKDADKDIQKELAGRGLLVHAEAYKHDYPFCWRADSDPLIQYARPAWYIRTTREKDQAIANNRSVNWLPEHIKEGRMGDFLAHNVDWALSRERYWGTPLNLWINDVTGAIDAPASVAAILERNPSAFDHFHAAKAKDPSLNEHLIVHKPWIDQVTWTKPGEEGVYRRVPEVIDAWFDSGCMPFAQWGWPHTEKGREKFDASFPADFISEAIDQTRGWFYSLLMVSTLLFGKSPYKTCIVLGHVSDKEGKKESKSKGNYTPPDVILDSVQMDFAVLDPNQVAALTGGKGGAAATLKPEDMKGRALIAREDLEGLDLKEGAVVRLSRPDHPGVTVDVPVYPHKALKRRVVVLPDEVKKQLNAHSTTKPDVKPMDVPWLPPAERVTLRDPSSPAPGADAFRWFFYASNPPWNATRHSLSNVRALQKEFLVKLRNVFSFFTIYANIDGFDPAGDSGKALVPIASRPELDRWILSELASTVAEVTADLDAYDVYAATGKLTSFVDALSNWYVRRSRDRFWRPLTDWTEHEDKKAAYQTLYEALVTLSQLIAPFVPYAAESMYRTLVAGPAEKGGTLVPESVHLTLYPAATPERIDPALSTKMRAVRELVSLGLQVRTEQKLKVRQPLAAAHVLVSDPALADALAGARSMIEDELNVQKVHLVGFAHASDYVSFQLKPSFRSLGQRGLGKEAQMLKTRMAALAPAEASAFYAQLAESGTITVEGIALGREDVEVQFVTKGDFAAAGGKVGMVILDTKIDEELRELGFVRELQNRIQTARKELGLEYVDRIRVGVVGGERVTAAVVKHRGALAAEVLAIEVDVGHVPPGCAPEGVREIEVDGEAITLGVVRVLVS
jgi:isoleucyl-tRNA synthetase